MEAHGSQCATSTESRPPNDMACRRRPPRLRRAADLARDERRRRRSALCFHRRRAGHAARARASGRALDRTALVSSEPPGARELGPPRALPPRRAPPVVRRADARSEEHTYELQSLMRISFAVFLL